ncbi:MAG TPA: nucleotidyltransferase [Terriglobales bacterium]|nr:nucleotidyltransferase [Terriglobales bacterium]
MPEQAQKPLPVSSSIPPDFPAEQRDLFREVLTLLNQRGVPYVVSGAFALQKHTGIWRDTKDLDLFLPARHVNAALCHLKEDGFEVEVTDPFWLAKAWRNGFFVDMITGMSNGVITVDDSWIARGVPADVVGVSTRVLAAEELVASKLFVSFRERFDGADIAHVLYRTHHRFDWNRMLELVGEHWQLLLWTMVLFHYIYPSAGGHVPRAVWDELLRRFQRLLEHPDSAARFRGSLIDDKMFLIDVQEWGMANLLEEERARRKDTICEPGKTAA